MPPLALVVENDSGTQRLLTVLLTRLGFEVDALANGSDALLLLADIRYQLMVLELFLPSASGTEVLEWLRANRADDLRRAVVISSAPPALVQRVRARFPDVAVLTKPFELTELTGAVDAMNLALGEGPALTPAQQFARRSVIAGAKAGVLVRRNGDELSLVHAFGYPVSAVQPWFPVPTDAGYPLSMCVREAQPQWFASLASAARTFPALEAVWRQHGSNALASVPVVSDGEVIGAAGWTFREPQLFDESEQRAFLAIATEAATAIKAA